MMPLTAVSSPTNTGLARGFKAWSERAALRVREELGLAPTAPLEPQRLAKHLAVTLCSPEEIPGLSATTRDVLGSTEADGWSAVTISRNGRDVIIYNPRNSPARRASDLMHELAHLLLGHEPSRFFFAAVGGANLRSYDPRQEAEAAWLAGCLLLPRPALLHMRNAGLSSAIACRTYGVSQDLLRYRLSVTGVNRQVERAGRK